MAERREDWATAEKDSVPFTRIGSGRGACDHCFGSRHLCSANAATENESATDGVLAGFAYEHLRLHYRRIANASGPVYACRLAYNQNQPETSWPSRPESIMRRE